ncbi:HNH endonuclease [Scytonema tolypothrichoides VB-61278]|nr:HNH endonuclease [Scytonema tolypothrichoides VB-61278]
MSNLIAPQHIKIGIFRCLKAGTNPEFPEQGTPQGGVISPLLANIALNGIESIHKCHVDNKRKLTPKTPQKYILEPSIRYADDMVIILRPEDDAEEILKKIDQFLADKGMNISKKKTKVTASTEGFDFLGWHFKVQSNGKFRSTPSVDNYKAFRKKVKAIVNSSNYGSEVKAQKLAPLVRGWRNYHRYCKMDGSRNSLCHIETRAFKKFNKEKENDRHSSKKLLDKAFPDVPYSENKFVSVQGEKSPFNGDTTYWSERNSKLYDGKTSKALNRQNHSCGICGMKMIPGETVHLHHVDGNHQNWATKNCYAVHQTCHQYHHMSKEKS